MGREEGHLSKARKKIQVRSKGEMHRKWWRGGWVGGGVHKEQEFFLFYRSTLFPFILAEFRKPEAQSVSCSLLRKDLKIRL